MHFYAIEMCDATVKKTRDTKLAQKTLTTPVSGKPKLKITNKKISSETKLIQNSLVSLTGISMRSSPVYV